MVKPVESSLPQTSAELALTDYEFVQRVANISYVNKSLEMLNQKILPVVESNPYTKFAADTAASVAAAVVKPVLKTVEPYHDRVDSVGNRLVDVAENVVESGTKFALRAEQVLLSPLEKAVNGVDYVVDLVLPASEQEQRKFDEQQFVDANDNLSDEASTEDFPESESTVGPRPAPLKRAYEVSTKAGTRVYNVITSRSQKAYESTEELLHLRATWEILQHYQAQLEASSQKLRETLAATQQYLQETVSDREKLATSVQDAKDFGMEKIAKPTFESVLIVQNRLVEALAEVRSSVTHSIDAVRNRVPSLPFNIQERVSDVVSTASRRWEDALKKFNEQTSSGEGQTVSVEALLANVRALTQKSISVIDASTESIEVVSRTKHILGTYLGISKPSPSSDEHEQGGN